MPFAYVNGVNLHYQIHGSGAPLLFLGGTAWDLRHAKSSFELALQERFQVLRFDQRGQGQSDKPDSLYTMHDYAADAAALLQTLAWPSLPVVGISFGGMVAQHLALDFPEKVSRLVLCCTSSGGLGGSSYPLHLMQDLPAEDYAREFLRLANVSYDAEWQKRHAARYQGMLKFITDGRRQLDDDAKTGLRHQLAARQMHDCWQRLPEIRVPTLVCGGDQDGICPPANLHALASRIEGAKLEMFSGGHGFYMEDARAASCIGAFLT